MRARPPPEDVGVLAMEVYLPRRCICREELESFEQDQEITAGQEYVGYVDDLEDMNSIALTTVSALLRKCDIDPRSIGFLEIVTESSVENTKSVRRVLMDLFRMSGNTDIEGGETKKGCYGSTSALFNSINWIESSSWDRRNAIVFSGDIAMYAKGSASHIGGVGGVAMLIGPNAPLVLEPAHGNFVDNLDDFYAPGHSPQVDAQVAVPTYLVALEESYRSYRGKRAMYLAELSGRNDARNKPNNGTSVVTETHEVNDTNDISGVKPQVSDDDSGREPTPPVFSLSEFDYLVYHSSYGTIAQKSHATLHYNEYLAEPHAEIYAGIPASMRSIPREGSLLDRDIERTFLHVFAADFAQRVTPSLALGRRCGYIGATALYGALASLLDSVPSYELFEKRIALFAYDAGYAGSFFALRVKGDTKQMHDKMDLGARLRSMRPTSLEEYATGLNLQAKNRTLVPYTPEVTKDNLWPGSYYLVSVCPRGQRSYAVA
ncbi:putative hydroxymethylglutaryl-CoA synthase [Gautieria morchelliformis]|nr:putative hydroxymethylglutaryl-CoA synthase [Gautieria morchelliformis]